MEIKSTKDYQAVPNIMMLVYGQGGMGKTTFSSTFPKPLLLDFENGAKYFKDRGIEIDVANFSKWLTKDEKIELDNALVNYETIVVDPIGEAMDKLIESDTISGSKNRQSSGDLTMAGWGAVKKEMRNFLKYLRDTGKNVVLVAHVDEKDDEGSLVKCPMIATKLSQEVINMVDIVGYMTSIQKDGEDVRIIRVEPSEKFKSKDRTGKLGKVIKPDYNYIIEQMEKVNDIIDKVPSSYEEVEDTGTTSSDEI
jgi:phage nucleotide-binding protein